MTETRESDQLHSNVIKSGQNEIGNHFSLKSEVRFEKQVDNPRSEI